MNIEEIKRLVREFHRVDYKNLFGALITYETEDYLHSIDDLNKGDMDFLEGLYDYFMNRDDITGLMDANALIEDYKNDLEEEER